MSKLMTPRDVAEKLGMSPEHVRILIKTGQMRAYTFGSKKLPRYKVSEEQLEEFLSLRAIKEEGLRNFAPRSAKPTQPVKEFV